VSASENKALVRKFYEEVWVKGNLDVADEVFAPDYVRHDLRAGGRWTASGTHLGRWGGIEPTGRQVTFSAVNIFRLEKGKVAEVWNHRDDLGLMQQVGAPIHAGAQPESSGQGPDTER
jgi:predicted SnoaL-like aldol condensation-catalyzing enzyme